MKNELSREQVKAILQELHKALDEGPWQDSKFLHAIGKKLESIRDNFANHVTAVNELHQSKKSGGRRKLQEGQQEIYISLYSSSGNQIKNWVPIIANLPRQIISRPIYEKEEDIKEVLRAKKNKNNEGYVAIVINQSDVLPTHPDKMPKDKMGKLLLTLKDRTIHTENINRFVHISGTYQYLGGRLIKDNSEPENL